ncbi:tetratricopeptide repeat protein [Phormidium sp. FACHB-1136]|uniref:tetratricopeptide repeat protein n=1 Tax=Phormidium sp. FACHB-1136 TaxID=2692848 RepID=UPI001684BA1F|nr:tetratricopeptide repeat protein [Phormidium sp. FACHB-1136]MBD2427775.1 tetratricopeptide repeat protein [Phormidium sp. FACHB-1136]
MSTELITWLVVVLGILGFGMGSMLVAYRWPAGATVLFPAPVTELSIPMTEQARTLFQAGIDAFEQGRYAQAIGQFSEVIALEPTCAEALYNGGLAYANLGNDNLAVQALLQASDRYNQQGTKAGLDRVKYALEQVAVRQKHRRTAKDQAGQNQVDPNRAEPNQAGKTRG